MYEKMLSPNTPVKPPEHNNTRSPASAGIANRPLVFLGIFFNFRTRMMKLGVQVAKGCHFHVVKTE